MIYTITLINIIILSLLTRYIKISQRRKFFCICVFLMLGLLSGFRYQNEYSDFWVNYQRIIQVADQSWGDVIHYTTSIVHQGLRKIVADVFKDPQVYFVIAALFFVGVHVLCFYKYANNIFLCVLLFYCEFGYFAANNVTRQGIAVAVTLLAWKYLLSKKNTRFWLLIVIATMVHMSTLFFVPLFFLSRFNFNRRNIFAYGFLGGLIVIFYDPISRIAQRFIYTEYVATSYGITPANILRLSVAVICGVMIYIYTVRKEDGICPKNDYLECNAMFDNFILNGTFIFVVCTILASLKVLMLSRVALYFAPCAILCIDQSVSRVQNIHTRRMILCSITVFMLVWFATMNYSGKLIPTPYTPFWQFPDRPKI